MMLLMTHVQIYFSICVRVSAWVCMVYFINHICSWKMSGISVFVETPELGLQFLLELDTTHFGYCLFKCITTNCMVFFPSTFFEVKDLSSRFVVVFIVRLHVVYLTSPPQTQQWFYFSVFHCCSVCNPVLCCVSASFGTGSMSMPSGFGNPAAFNLPTSFSGTFQPQFPGQAPFPQPPAFPQQPNGLSWRWSFLIIWIFSKVGMSGWLFFLGGGFPAFVPAKPMVTPFGQPMPGPGVPNNPFLVSSSLLWFSLDVRLHRVYLTATQSIICGLMEDDKHYYK